MSVRSVCVTPDGRRAVSGSADETLRVWDLETGYSSVLRGHTGGIECLAATPDGRCAVAWSLDALHVWDLETGHCRALDGHTDTFSVAVTPDGRRAVSGSRKNLRIWDLETGRSYIIHGDTRYDALCVTPDGRRVVAWSRCALHVWDLETGHCRALEGHTDTFSVAVTPDGRRAVSGSRKNLRIWDLETGEIIGNYVSAADVRSVAQRFPTLAAGTSGGRVEFLRLAGPRHAADLPLLGPRITTLACLWLHAKALGVTGGRWDDAFTATCGACGQRFQAPVAVLDAIAAINRTASTGEEDWLCLGLPGAAWADPHLLGECPLCHEPLNFNPFVVDNRDRYPAPLPDPDIAGATQSDIRNMRMYFRHLALLWWRNNTDSKKCDDCMRAIAPGEGYVFGAIEGGHLQAYRLCCEGCLTSVLDAPEFLQKLQRNPNHMGDGLIQKVREYAERNR